MQLSAQSGLVIVVNLLIVAVVAVIVLFLLKGHSRILLQRRSEESMKIDLPKEVQRTYEYATVCFSILRSQIWRQNWHDVRIGCLIVESKRTWENTWQPCSDKGIQHTIFIYNNNVVHSAFYLSSCDMLWFVYSRH